MANGYGSSPLVRTTTTTTNGIQAPPGFHYMPDGTLMSDAEHTRLYGQKIITSFNLETPLSFLYLPGGSLGEILGLISMATYIVVYLIKKKTKCT